MQHFKTMDKTIWTSAMWFFFFLSRNIFIIRSVYPNMNCYNRVVFVPVGKVFCQSVPHTIPVGHLDEPCQEYVGHQVLKMMLAMSLLWYQSPDRAGQCSLLTMYNKGKVKIMFPLHDAIAICLQF